MIAVQWVGDLVQWVGARRLPGLSYVLAGRTWKSCHSTSATGRSHRPGRDHPTARYGELVGIGQVFLLSDAVYDGEEMREYVSVGWRSHHARLGLIRLDPVICLAARGCRLLFKSSSSMQQHHFHRALNWLLKSYSPEVRLVVFMHNRLKASSSKYTRLSRPPPTCTTVVQHTAPLFNIFARDGRIECQKNDYFYACTIGPSNRSCLRDKLLHIVSSGVSILSAASGEFEGAYSHSDEKHPAQKPKTASIGPSHNQSLQSNLGS
jgi:hypothetical protein